MSLWLFLLILSCFVFIVVWIGLLLCWGKPSRLGSPRNDYEEMAVALVAIDKKSNGLRTEEDLLRAEFATLAEKIELQLKQMESVGLGGVQH